MTIAKAREGLEEVRSYLDSVERDLNRQAREGENVDEFTEGEIRRFLAVFAEGIEE